MPAASSSGERRASVAPPKHDGIARPVELVAAARRRIFVSPSARWTRLTISSSDSPCSSTTRERLISAEFTSKNGFPWWRPPARHAIFHGVQQRVLLAAVEPVDLVDERDGAPDRTPTGACNRVDLAAQVRHGAADSDTSTNVAFVVSAMTCASEVLPVPAGPNRMTELSWSCSMALRSHEPGPTASSWPTTLRACAGACAPRGRNFDFRSFSISVNSVSMPRIVPCERLFAFSCFVDSTKQPDVKTLF